jgi:hypothetical protein
MTDFEVNPLDLLKIAWDPGDFYIVEWIGERRGFWIVKDINTEEQMVCRPDSLCHKEKLSKELTDEQLEVVCGGMSPKAFSYWRAKVINGTG